MASRHSKQLTDGMARFLQQLLTVQLHEWASGMTLISIIFIQEISKTQRNHENWSEKKRCLKDVLTASG